MANEDMLAVDFDFFVEITFRPSSIKKSVIRTNVRRERLSDILVDWIREQFGRGSYDDPLDHRHLKGEYVVKIGLSLAEDTFRTESDTGNRAVTVGIVAMTIANLDRFKVLSLE